MTAKKVPNGSFSQVLAVLPQGMEKPVTVAEISQITGLSVRDVYSILRSLLMDYDIPIGGTRDKYRHGVFVATTEAERKAAIIPLANNANELARRVEKLKAVAL